MEPQLKRGILEACILSVLSRGDSYGYQIIKELPDGIEISESTLYPILRRLEGAGCLDAYQVAHNGRLRKFYRITDKGKEQIKAYLESWKELEIIYNYISKGFNA